MTGVPQHVKVYFFRCTAEPGQRATEALPCTICSEALSHIVAEHEDTNADHALSQGTPIITLRSCAFPPSHSVCYRSEEAHLGQ